MLRKTLVSSFWAQYLILNWSCFRHVLSNCFGWYFSASARRRAWVLHDRQVLFPLISRNYTQKAETCSSWRSHMQDLREMALCFDDMYVILWLICHLSFTTCDSMTFWSAGLTIWRITPLRLWISKCCLELISKCSIVLIYTQESLQTVRTIPTWPI